MSETALVGRDRPLRELFAALDRSLAGNGSVISLVGEAGIGKTALLDAVEARTQRPDVIVMRARPEEIERGRPFGVIRTVLGCRPEVPEAAAVAALFDVSAEGPGAGWIENPETRFRAVDLFVLAIERMAADHKIVLLLDDLQWADESSLLAIQALLRRVPELAVLVILSARPTADPTLLRVFEHVPAGHRLEVSALDADAVAALAGAVVDAPVPAELLPLLDRAGGNPFFVIELAESWQRQPEDGPRVPESLRASAVVPSEFAGGDAGRMLQVAAVVGRPLSVDLLAELLDEPVLHVAAQVEAAVAARLLRDSDGRMAFRHDLVREIVLDSIPPSVRSALHLMVGRHLLARHAGARDVAAHFVAGAEPGDLEAVRVLRIAADELGRVAPGAARELLERAVELVPEGHSDHGPTIAELAQACVFSADLERGIRLTDELLARPLPEQTELKLRNARSQVFFLQGRAREAAVEFEKMAPLVAGRPREAVLLADAAVSSMFAIDLAKAEDLARRSLDAASRTEDRVGPVLANGVRSWLRCLSGDLVHGLELAETAVRLADDGDGLEGHRRIPHLFHAQALLWMDCVDEARRSMSRGRRMSSELGMGWDEPMYHALAADERIRAGEWDDALAEVLAGLARGEETGSHFADGWLLAHRARVLLGRGDLSGADAALKAGASALAGGGGQGRDLLWWCEALLASTRGEVVAGHGSLVALWHGLEALGTRLRQVELAPDLVRSARATRDDETASTVLEWLEASPLADAAIGAANRHWAAGLVNDDAAALRAAADLHTLRGAPVDAALCRLDLASLLEGAEAERLAREAGRFLAAVRAEAGPDEADSDPWSTLTRSERRVVELVARGLTNTDIAEALSVSRRTVESHLYHAYPKLGVSTRLEVAVVAANRAGSARPAPD